MDSNTKGCSSGEARFTITNSPTIHINTLLLPIKIDKGWGYELILHNGDGYCGKILHFNKGAEFSMHFHAKKHETWYVSYGKLILKYIGTETGILIETALVQGNVYPVKQLLPHQLFAVEESEIFEMSTEDDVNDSYRVWKGDSQK